MKTAALAILAIELLSVACGQADGDAAITVSAARRDAQGFLIHDVRSPFQPGTTLLRVLLPENLEAERRYPVVYVLPVEAGIENRYGDGLLEIKQHKLHHRLSAVFVAPTFAQLPWYADHPSDPTIRQESHFLKVVVPFIEQNYPVQMGAEGRHLLGFSKSGWGAFSLLLRHPELFANAAAWDAPLMMDRHGLYGSGPIFETAANFEAYRISSLLKARAETLQSGKRLILLGYGNFRDHHRQAQAMLSELAISHEFKDGPTRKHDWHSGWVAEAAEFLLPDSSK